MGSRKRKDSPPKMTELTMQSISVLPSTLLTPTMSFCPRRMDEMVEPPADTKLPKAAVRFIIGKVMARPAMAMAPTPCPMKMLSMML